MDSNTDDEKHVVAASASNENANANSRPINWTSIVTDDKGSETSCQRLSDFRGKSESSKLKMNLGESLHFKSSSNNSSSNIGGANGNGVETSSPLDFSMKKRKLLDYADQKFGSNNNGSAFETVISNNFIQSSAKHPPPSPSASLGYGNLLMGQSPNSSSPFLLNPSMFPLSLAAVASVHQNFGAAHQQSSASSTMVDLNNRKSLGPSSSLNGANGSLLAQHLASQPQQTAMAKNQRPFKAYDPLKPGSALNINSFLPPNNLAAASPLLNTGVNQQIFSDQLLAQYCQYLISAQTIASMNKQKSVDDVHRQMDCRNTFSIKTNNNNNCRSNGGDSTTVSPPQVTSTSHPHIDSSTPPASSGLDSSSSSVSVGNGAESICNGDNDNDKSESNDMRDSTSPLIIENCASRRRGKSLPEELKDEAYWERRRKNNEAAKRSRDLRRAKEDEIAIRAALLEQENSRLRVEVAALKAETEKLRQMLLNS